jgi:hypothetical protein
MMCVAPLLQVHLLIENHALGTNFGLPKSDCDGLGSLREVSNHYLI